MHAFTLEHVSLAAMLGLRSGPGSLKVWCVTLVAVSREAAHPPHISLSNNVGRVTVGFGLQGANR